MSAEEVRREGRRGKRGEEKEKEAAFHARDRR